MKRWIPAALCLLITVTLAAAWRPDASPAFTIALLGFGFAAAWLMSDSAPGTRTESAPAPEVLSSAPAPTHTVSVVALDPGAEPAGAVRSWLAPLGGILIALGSVFHGQSRPAWGLALWALGFLLLWKSGARAPDASRWLHTRRAALLLGVWSLVFIALFPPFWTTPAALYNWEDYTVGGLLGTYRGEYAPDGSDVPFGMLYSPRRLLEVSLPWRQGLMTDSYRTLLGGTPAAAAMWLFGVNLFSLRVYSVCMSLAAVALIVLLGRTLSPERPATASLSGLILAATPVFLVYGRTGTDVGPTLTWSLLVLLFIARLLWRNPRSWRDAAALGAAIGLSPYFYAVIRLQVLALLGWLALLLVLRRFRPGWWASVAFVAGFLVVASPQISYWSEVKSNFLAGRGEQVLAMSTSPEELRRAFPGETFVPPFSWSVRLRFIRHYVGLNLQNWYRLFTGVNLSPAVSDYWNPRGEILHAALLALGMIGFALSWRSLPFERGVFLLLIFIVGACPSLMTNNVHAGRVLLALPAMVYWVALSIGAIGSWCAVLLRGGRRLQDAVLVMLLVFLAWHTSASFVERLRAHAFPHRNYSRAVAEAVRDTSETRLIVPAFPLEAAAIQFFAHPTHRLWLWDRPYVPEDRGPQPGDGVLRVIVAECEQSTVPMWPPGTGPVFVKAACARRWLGAEIEIESLPGTSDFVAMRELVSVSSGLVVWLMEIEASETKFEFAPPRNNANWDGGPLLMNGRTYLRGIGAHAPMRLAYPLPGSASQFRTIVGLHDATRTCGGGRAAVTFTVSTDTGGVLFESGIVDTRSKPREVDVDVRGARELVIQVSDGGNGGDCDHAILGNPHVVLSEAAAAPQDTPALPSDAPPALRQRPAGVEATPEPGESALTMPLAQLQATAVEYGFAEPRMGRTWDGQPIVMAGRVYADGIGMHAWTNMTFSVPANAVTFRALVGLSDHIRACSQAGVTFEIRDDLGRLLFDSGFVGPQTGTLPVRAAVRGVRAILLTVTDGGNGRDCDHANWADARFVLAED
jgi:hypothetical protein